MREGNFSSGLSSNLHPLHRVQVIKQREKGKAGARPGLQFAEGSRESGVTGAARGREGARPGVRLAPGPAARPVLSPSRSSPRGSRPRFHSRPGDEPAPHTPGLKNVEHGPEADGESGSSPPAQPRGRELPGLQAACQAPSIWGWCSSR